MVAFQEVIDATGKQPTGLTVGGWIFLSVAWTTIIGVAVFCYRKVLQKAVEKRRRGLRDPRLPEDKSRETVRP